MAMFSDVVAFLASHEEADNPQNKRTLLTPEQAQELRLEHPGIPEAFIAYLGEVGAGALLECHFTVYGWLGTPAEILGEGVLKLKERRVRFLCFGDGFDGNFMGFIPAENWVIAILLHDCGGALVRYKEPFEVLIRKRMGMVVVGEV